MGVLYVVDSVTRQWVEAARKSGQQAGSAAPDGTFAAGVNRVTELLPVLMTDIINNAPEDQKVRWTHGFSKKREQENTPNQKRKDEILQSAGMHRPISRQRPNLS